jgi:hypothetical protein
MAKQVLDMLLWHPEKKIRNCTVIFIHRGAPGNLKKMDGGKIKSLEGGFMILEDETKIPCHRVIRIECDQDIIWEKHFKERENE